MNEGRTKAGGVDEGRRGERRHDSGALEVTTIMRVATISHMPAAGDAQMRTVD